MKLYSQLFVLNIQIKLKRSFTNIKSSKTFSLKSQVLNYNEYVN